MSVSLRVTGTWAELIADGSVAIPATPQAGDRMYLFAGWKDFSVTAQVTSPSGWTELVEFADGAVSAGNGTGSVKVACWYRDWQSGDTDPTIDFSAAPDNAAAVIMVMRKDADDIWLTPVAVTAAMTNWTTSSQIVSASSTAAVPSGGVVMGLIRLRDDSAVMTRPASGIDDSAAAITWNGDYVESPVTHHSTTTGFDGATDLGYRLVTTGASGVTLRMTGTISAAETGAALWVVQGVNVQVTPTTATLSSSQFAPSLKLTITPASASLTSTSFAPQLREVITPAQANLSVTGFAPSLNLIVTPPSATLSLTSFAPQLREVLTPANAALSVSSFAPSLNTTITPDAALLLMTSFAPDVTQNTLITIPVASLVVTTSRPHVLPFKLIYLDPGGDATHAVGHFNQLIAGFGTDVTYDPTQQVAGAGSYRFDSNTNENPAAVILGILGPSRRVSAYFRYDSVPDAVVNSTRFVNTFQHYSGGNEGFDDVLNLTADDGLYATATPAQNSGQGTAYGTLGFDEFIPIGAAIVSVKIIYEVKVNTVDSIAVSRVKYRLNGVEGPNHDNTSEPLTDTVITVDITGDRDWRREDLLDAVFEVIAEARRGDTATAHTQSWDYVKVEVIYRQDAILQVVDDANEPCWHIGLVPRGDHCVLRFADGAGVDYYGSTKLSPNTNNRISFGYLEHAGGLDINLFVNAIQELSIVDAARGTLVPIPVPRLAVSLRYGWVNSPGVDHVCWFSQIAIDDGDDLQDIGNLLMTAKLPAAVNENNWSTTVGTGAVDERPLSETNHMRHNPATAARQTYTLQAASVGDVDISGAVYRAHMGWAWARATATTVEEVSLIVNNVNFDRTLQLGTTASLLRASVVSPNYPSHAAGIGMTGNIDTADILMFECGVIQAYQGPDDDPLFPLQLLQEDTSSSVSDNMGGLPPAEYELRNDIPAVAGTVITTTISSRTAEGETPQQQAIIESSGGDEIGIVTVSPGIEVSVNIDVAGADAEVGLRRVDEIIV